MKLSDVVSVSSASYRKPEDVLDRPVWLFGWERREGDFGPYVILVMGDQEDSDPDALYYVQTGATQVMSIVKQLEEHYPNGLSRPLETTFRRVGRAILME